MDLDFVRKGTTAQRAETSCVDVDVRKGTTAQRAETSCVDVDIEDCISNVRTNAPEAQSWLTTVQNSI